MPDPQLQFFTLGSSLLDASLEQRAAAAQLLLEAEATDLAEREELLALIVWPAAWAEAQS